MGACSSNSGKNILGSNTNLDEIVGHRKIKNRMNSASTLEGDIEPF